MEILWIWDFTPSYDGSFILEIVMIYFFFGQNLTISAVIFAKQKMIRKRHKVRNKYVLRFLLEFITETCSKIKYFKLAFNVFSLTYLSVLYATTKPLKSWLQHQLSHLQVTFLFFFCLNYRWKRGVFNDSIHSRMSSTILQGKHHWSTYLEMFLLFIENLQNW